MIRSGKSGVAHFLEHLTFKGTKKHPQGEFSNPVAEFRRARKRLSRVTTTRLTFNVSARRRLGALMAFEADRMCNLLLTDEVVAPERDVVLEERRMRTDF